MPQRKFNHSGVDIYIPDDAKYEAILTLDGEDVKVGRKDFETFDEFKSWLERQAGDLQGHVRMAKGCATRCKVATRELTDAQEAVGKIKRADYESDEEFMEATHRASQRLQQAMMEKQGADDMHKTHDRTACGMKEALGVKEKTGR